jgi:tetratricopeptide (TPR) repeat protein
MNSPPAADNPQTALQDALALHRSGQHELAMKGYVAILQKNPGNVDALYYVAMLALQQNQLAEGLKVIARALDIAPREARLHNLAGQAHLRLNQDDEALQSFGRAIEAERSFPDAYGNRGTLLSEMGRAAEALADFDRALALRPNNAEDHCNRASALADLGRYDEALAGFARAIALIPAMAPAYFNRADVLRRLGRLPEALADYDRMIQLYPEHPAAHGNRGLVLKELGRLPEAKSSIGRALELDPNFAEGLVSRANMAFEEGRLAEAGADYDRALELQPAIAEASHGRALTYLCAGDWANGFALYEARERLREPPFKPLPFPRWTADAAPGERLVLLCEQGLGDMIQLSRFAPLFAERGFDVTLLALPSMQPLLSTLKGVTVAGLGDAPTVNGKPTRWLPLMSAPHVLDLRPDNVPADVPYLAAEPSRIAQWEAWLGGGGFKIGINWALGNQRSRFARRRDVPLAAFAPLAAIPGVRLISLQVGPPTQQIETVAFRDKIETPEMDVNPADGSFLDTAALMTKLDLIVSCDTSLVHLAGALARPVFTALPLVPDWRWMQEREDTPWYPTMRLFRQRAGQGWDDVFTRIAAATAEMASAQQR